MGEKNEEALEPTTNTDEFIILGTSPLITSTVG